ncbi:MAG: SGNH/GDSL hydrolase family protein [Oscillospiraceae bacterium]|nr:SGNH/GDSL hydrolase family protein [Oscillospiraceae bacterium]
MQIFLLGDSLSRGIMFDKEKGRFSLLRESFCNLMRPKLKTEVVNISGLGRTLDAACDALEQQLLVSKPQAVAIELGGNDCDYNWAEVAEEPHAAHECKTSFARFEQGIRELVARLRREDILSVLINLPPIDADRYFRFICRDDPKMEKGILSFIGSITHIYWWHERFSSVIGKIADEMGAHFIDIRRAFLYQEDYREFICDDGIHPNASGHKLIAECINDFVAKHYSYMLIPGNA